VCGQRPAPGLESHDEAKEMTEKTIETLVNSSIDFEETRVLVGEMTQIVENELANIGKIKYCNSTLELLLRSTIEDL